ncbi:MAG: hypothetical protein ABS49_08540 [Erythrobacter sp. SCN 62-14]|nr:MAG: hypothetical protein ABS49_08540 [Erythrobacter sp. SCN 62-14]
MRGALLLVFCAAPSGYDDLVTNPSDSARSPRKASAWPYGQIVVMQGNCQSKKAALAGAAFWVALLAKGADQPS